MCKFCSGSKIVKSNVCLLHLQFPPITTFPTISPSLPYTCKFQKQWNQISASFALAIPSHHYFSHHVSLPPIYVQVPKTVKSEFCLLRTCNSLPLQLFTVLPHTLHTVIALQSILLSSIHCIIHCALHYTVIALQSTLLRSSLILCTAHTLYTCIVHCNWVSIHSAVQPLQYFCTDTQKVCTAQNCTMLQ